MSKSLSIKCLAAIAFMFLLVGGVFAQNGESNSKSPASATNDDVPALVTNLPDWENARNRAAYILKPGDLSKTLGERPVFDLIDFTGGAEAVSAPYPQGKLLIVEYYTPQASVDADNKIKARLAEIGANAPISYRRIGNFNAFVFDAPDETAANSLLDQVKYEKKIQWLGTNPFEYRAAERAFIKMTSDLFVTTVVVIVGGLGLSILAGIVVGMLFFYLRAQKRAGMEAFSDAGGMTRLNLDGLTPQTTPADRLLKQ